MQPPKNRIIAIASGKGGVGKTIVTANLALALAQHFRPGAGSVVAMDVDLGCGNLNSCLGVRSPNGTVNQFIQKQVSSLKKVVTPTTQQNLEMICASYGRSHNDQLNGDSIDALFSGVRDLNANFVLLDLGAGTSEAVLDLFLGASERIILVTPESLSLDNAFVFLKAAMLRFLQRELGKEEFLSPLRSSLTRLTVDQESLNIHRVLEKMKNWDRFAAYVLGGMIEDLNIKFIVNMYRGGSERSHLRRFHRLVFEHLQLSKNISYLGFIHFDRGVAASVQAIKPFLLQSPSNRAATDIGEVAQRLIDDQELDTIPSLYLPPRFPWLAKIWPP